MSKPQQCTECWQFLPEHTPKCSKGAKVAAQRRAHTAKRVERYGNAEGFQLGEQGAADLATPKDGD
jgi:hypothetical protein